MANILIIGASRGIGLEATKEALARGHIVRAMARSAQDMALRHDKLERVNGSALNASDVLHALDGVSAVILSLGLPVTPQMLVGPVSLFSEATEVVVQAMTQAGVRRLIAVTGFGTGDSRASMTFLESIPFRLLLGRVYHDKDVQEAIIRASTLDWVVARPGILNSGRKSSKYKVLVTPASWRNGTISRADVADFLVNQVEGDTYIGKMPVLIR